MALLLEGGVHSLSSSNKHNKSVVYVKLTDSALKCFEDIARHKGTDLESPTIQLINSSGVLTVPHAGGGGNPQRFKFSIQNQQDASSFQCLKKTHQGLDYMGTMRETVRVKANDDVYEKTIQKQLDVQRQNEKKTTKLLENKDKKKLNLPRSNLLLKPNPAKTVPNPPSSSSRQYPSSATHSSATHSKVIPPFNFSTSDDSSSYNSYSGVPGRGSSRPPPAPPKVNSTYQEKHTVNKYEIKCHPSSINNKPPPNPEIVKRPLRERLLHLLAVKPYKKVELVQRLNRDGIREKDKKNIMTYLNEVAIYKNNIYELKRSVWNDVMEDWPFYTESDKAVLRRRKPQNLTPPGSDNGSTSSGHSPSSTNPPSPPQITNPLKRPSYYEQGSQEAAKKKRVSHYKRPADQMSGFSRSPYSLSGSSPMGMSGHGGGSSSNLSPSSGPVTSMERLDLKSSGNSTSIFEDPSAPDWGQFPDDNDQGHPIVAQPQPTQQPPQQHHQVSVEESSNFREREHAIAPLSRSNSPFYSNNSNNRSSPVPSMSLSQAAVSNRRSSPMVVASANDSVSRPPRANSAAGGGTSSPSARSWNSDYNMDAVSDSGSTSGSTPPLTLQENLFNSNKDFLTEYTRIVDQPMRKRYKRAFNSVYDQYMKYHNVMQNARKNFEGLSKELVGLHHSSPEYKRAREAILYGYNALQDPNCEWQVARTNFQYLHEKLAHIKDLVHEYDVTHRR